MTKKGQSITLSLQPSQKDAIELIALNNNCLHGNRGNISKLVSAIADGQLSVYNPHQFDYKTIVNFYLLWKTSLRMGKTDIAETVYKIVKDANPTDIPELKELHSYYESDSNDNIQLIKQFIKDKQCFAIEYSSIGGVLETLHIDHAYFVELNDASYLACHANEPNPKQGLEMLKGNWLLLASALNNADVTAIAGQWSYSLLSIPCVFELSNQMAFNYVGHPWDTNVFTDYNDKCKTTITRYVEFDWLFINEMVSYGVDCKILEPSSMVKRLLANVSLVFNNYFGSL